MWLRNRPLWSGAASPDDEGASRGVEVGVGLVAVLADQFETGVLAVHDDAHVPLAFGAEAHGEVPAGAWVVMAAPDQQQAAQHAHGVLGQLWLGQQLTPHFLVAGEVPAVDGELATHVGDELRHRHAPSGPRDDRLGLLGQDLVDG